MCLVGLICSVIEELPFIILHNREEFHVRPTTDPEHPFNPSHGSIVCGRDGLDGGTWEGFNTENGAFAALTNFHLEQQIDRRTVTSRGVLVEQILNNPFAANTLNQIVNSEKEVKEEKEELKEKELSDNHRLILPKKFAGYNMIFANFFSPQPQAYFLTNSPPEVNSPHLHKRSIHWKFPTLSNASSSISSAANSENTSEDYPPDALNGSLMGIGTNLSWISQVAPGVHSFGNRYFNDGSWKRVDTMRNRLNVWLSKQKFPLSSAVSRSADSGSSSSSSSSSAAAAAAVSSSSAATSSTSEFPEWIDAVFSSLFELMCETGFPSSSVLCSDSHGHHIETDTIINESKPREKLTSESLTSIKETQMFKEMCMQDVAAVGSESVFVPRYQRIHRHKPCTLLQCQFHKKQVTSADVVSASSSSSPTVSSPSYLPNPLPWSTRSQTIVIRSRTHVYYAYRNTERSQLTADGHIQGLGPILKFSFPLKAVQAQQT